MDETPHSGDRMPSTIGRYQVHESIGYGAMGAVYKAFDPLIKRTLAIKTIRLDIPRQSPQYKSFIERFYHEARISGTLSHPNIVTLFDIGEEGGLPYLAMEFVEGETISSILERGLRFKPEKVIGLVSQVASAIDYAHTKGVIHRDIKPSNLILFDTDRVKVTDFGIAKLVDAEMTQSGTLLGTPSYMSPEQAMGDKLDGRSDIFSLGVCAFEMLCGEQPFPGNNVTSILYKLVHVDPIEPANLEMNGLVPEKWHEVFGKVLAKKPDDRYQTSTEFVQDLEYCLGSWFENIDTPRAAAGGGNTAQDPTARMPVPEGGGAARKTHPPGSLPRQQTGARSVQGTGAGPQRKTNPPAPPTSTYGPGPGGRAVAPPAARRTGPPGARDSGVVPPRPPAPSPEGDEPATVLLKGPPPARRTGSVPQQEPAADEEPPATVSLRAPRGARPAAQPEPEEEEEQSTVVLPSPPRRAEPGRTGMSTMQRSASTRTPPPIPPTQNIPVPPTPVPQTQTAQPPALAEPRRYPLTLIFVGLGLLVLLPLAGFLAYYLWSSGGGARPTTSTTLEAVSTTAPPGAPLTGMVHVESTPSGATASVDGRSYGKTPIDIHQLEVDRPHEVKLELDGFTPWSQAITVTAAEPRAEVRPQLVHLPPSLGMADVRSTPAGGQIKVDGAPVGQTPATVDKLKPGPHQFAIAVSGYEPWSRRVAVTAGKTARVDAQLVPVPTPKPVVTKSLPPTTPAPPPIRTVNENETDVKPNKISCGSVEFPQSAPQLKKGQRASVTLAFVVTEAGEVTDVQVVESAGSLLDDAVIKGFATCKYSPGMKQGARVRVRMQRRHTFLGG